MRRIACLCATACFLTAVVGGTGASAAPDGSPAAAAVTSPALLALITNNDLFSVTNLSTVLAPAGPLTTNGTQHYGPYLSTSPDSGTCGNDWAQDTFDRHFTVRANGDGTYTVVEQFKNGSFVTNSGPSPGACETNPGGSIVAGKTGTMHGYFIISNVDAQTSSDPHCDAINNTNANCTTATFIDTHFAPCYLATCNVSTYFDHYTAGDQTLFEHEWKNASPDRGGDDGDIASS
jgi:hypothetical protein